MGRIERWTFENKKLRRDTIGDHIPCPICFKPDGLAVWEGERYLLCSKCGAKYQKKQFYRRPKKKETDGLK